MGLKNICIALSIGLLVAFLYGQWQYRNGWNGGRADLVKQQEEKARLVLAKKVATQQANDRKAYAAEQAGAAKTIVITQEVIRYVKNPDRTRCTFDDRRVSVKQRAVDNANSIPGYDDAAVPVPGS